MFIPDIEGDKISIFGFSRGAYTARCLAGMLHKVGLLPADNVQQIPFAYKMYTRVDHIGWEQSNGFKKAFGIDVTIDFLGVWYGLSVTPFSLSCPLTILGILLIPLDSSQRGFPLLHPTQLFGLSDMRFR